MPTPHQSFPILWSVRHGRAATYPIHSILGGHSSIPLFRGWSRGRPTWGPPPATLLKPPGLWERGKREKIPNTDQSAQRNLKELEGTETLYGLRALLQKCRGKREGRKEEKIEGGRREKTGKKKTKRKGRGERSERSEG